MKSNVSKVEFKNGINLITGETLSYICHFSDDEGKLKDVGLLIDEVDMIATNEYGFSGA